MTQLILDLSIGLTWYSDLIFSTKWDLEPWSSWLDMGESIVFLSSITVKAVVSFGLDISLDVIVTFVGNLGKEGIEVGGSRKGSAELNDNGLFKALGSCFMNLFGTLERRLDGGITKLGCA